MGLYTGVLEGECTGECLAESDLELLADKDENCLSRSGFSDSEFFLALGQVYLRVHIYCHFFRHRRFI
jgi:hypothetical protein